MTTRPNPQRRWKAKVKEEAGGRPPVSFDRPDFANAQTPDGTRWSSHSPYPQWLWPTFKSASALHDHKR
jgi:hypothetical protein